MRNDDFYDTLFPSYWRDLNRSNLVADEHSMFGDAQVFDWLVRTVKPREIIEVGSWKGHSANYVMDLCRAQNLDSRMVCVDTFLGGPEHWVLPGLLETMRRVNGRPSILEAFLGNTIARGNEGHIYPLCADSYAGAEILNYFKFEADLIFVDAGHDRVSVRRDIMGYFSRLSADGVMFGDDYQLPELAETVHECARELGMSVLVSARKWIFVNDALMRKLTLPDVQMRTSHAGWLHP